MPGELYYAGEIDPNEVVKEGRSFNPNSTKEQTISFSADLTDLDKDSKKKSVEVVVEEE
jgi:hypothetical protein